MTEEEGNERGEEEWYSEVKLLGTREEVDGNKKLASVKEADKIKGILKWRKQICEDLTKLYTRCVGLRNGYLRHYHGDDDDCKMVTFRKYRPNLQYKLVFTGIHNFSCELK